MAPNGRRVLLLVATVVAALSRSLGAEPLTPQERQRLIEYLERSRDQIIAEVSGLSAAQAVFQPAVDRWSIVHCIEHLAIVEETVRRMNAKLMAEPPTSARRAELEGREDLLVQTAQNRTRKFQAPEAIRPTGRYPTLERALAAFLCERQTTIDYVRTTSDALRDHVTRHPVLDVPLDGYQFLFGVPAHTERHQGQIREIKAAPGFPAIP